MPLPEVIDASSDPCGLARRWLLDPDFAARLVRLVGKLNERFTAERLSWPTVRIISGYRNAETAASVGSNYETSCHSTCPALAADLSLGNIEWPADAVVQDDILIWAMMGGEWELMGGRWGGRFSWDGPFPGAYNLEEKNHFDWGPCLGMARP